MTKLQKQLRVYKQNLLDLNFNIIRAFEKILYWEDHENEVEKLINKINMISSDVTRSSDKLSDLTIEMSNEFEDGDDE